MRYKKEIPLGWSKEKLEYAMNSANGFGRGPQASDKKCISCLYLLEQLKT